MNVKSLIAECVKEVLAEVSKRDYPHLFMQMHPSDRKTIRYWHVSDEGETAIIDLYSSLVGFGMTEFLFEFVDSRGGDMRMFPDKGLICIQMRIPTKRL